MQTLSGDQLSVACHDNERSKTLGNYRAPVICNRALPALAAATASFGWMAPKLLLFRCAVRWAMPLARSCKFAFGMDSSARTCSCTFVCLFFGV